MLEPGVGRSGDRVGGIDARARVASAGLGVHEALGPQREDAIRVCAAPTRLQLVDQGAGLVAAVTGGEREREREPIAIRGPSSSEAWNGSSSMESAPATSPSCNRARPNAAASSAAATCVSSGGSTAASTAHAASASAALQQHVRFDERGDGVHVLVGQVLGDFGEPREAHGVFLVAAEVGERAYRRTGRHDFAPTVTDLLEQRDRLATAVDGPRRCARSTTRRWRSAWERWTIHASASTFSP